MAVVRHQPHVSAVEMTAAIQVEDETIGLQKREHRRVLHCAYDKIEPPYKAKMNRIMRT